MTSFSEDRSYYLCICRRIKVDKTFHGSEDSFGINLIHNPQKYP